MPASSQTAYTSADTADFLFRIEGADNQQLRVAAFSGSEGLSQLYQFDVELVSDEPDLDFDAIVGKGCTLEWATETGPRYMNGIVRAFQRLHEGSSRTHYAAEIVPKHWLLTRRRSCRIFQAHNSPDMSVPGIVKKVLRDAGLPDSALRLALQGQYPPREFVVQYRESDMDFISRLLEDEGIFYFFEHTADGHVMVLGDSPIAHVPTAAKCDYPFRTLSGLLHEREFIFAVRNRREVQTGKVSLDDFNFAKPPMDADMIASLAAAEGSGLEFHDYPGGYESKDRGQGYAQLRLQEFQCAREVLSMSCSVRSMKPGFTFELIEHPAQRLNREYVVVQVLHRGRQPQSGEEEAIAHNEVGYDAEIRTIPAGVPYRPPRVTPRPRVHGSQTALVVGPKSEEIYTDEFARVKVQFHWDREGAFDERSSCWIRVSQAWAGGEYGVMFLPRVGHEVIVDFLEGDPDKPIITGRVHNADLMPTFPPDEKHLSGIWTQSTKGGDGCSALVFDDEKSKEMVFLHSQKDLELTAERDCAEHYGRNSETVIDDSRYELIRKRHQCEVKLDHDEKIGGNKSQIVRGSVSESFGSHSESAGSYTLTTNKGEVVIESCSKITLKVGGNFVTIHGGGVDIVGSVVNINSGGSPGNGTGGSFPEFEEVYAAEYAEPPGYDKSYNKGGSGSDGASARADQGAAQSTTDEEKQTTWIEIELVDECGQPWPNEPYEITEPDGTVHKGALDAQGQAHVAVKNPGECQISFPKLDLEAWRRA